MSSKWVIFSSIAALLMTMSASPAFAQSQEERREARSLFEQAATAVEARDYPNAIRAYEESYRLYPHPGTLLNMALCFEAAGEALRAFRAWEELLERFGTVISESARSRAEASLSRLGPQLARARIITRPEGAEVAIDGRGVGTAPFSEPILVDPGRREFRARLSGHESASTRVNLVAGEITDVMLELRPAASPTERSPAPRETESGWSALPERDDESEEDEPRRRRRGFWRSPWPWLIGCALIATGVSSSVVGLNIRNDRPDAQWWVRLP